LSGVNRGVKSSSSPPVTGESPRGGLLLGPVRSATSLCTHPADFRRPRRRAKGIIGTVKDCSALGLLATLALGCGVQREATSLERDVAFPCITDADCAVGSCLAEFGICTQDDGELEYLLFEVTPQASDPVYGGARFLTLINVAAAPPDGARLPLKVEPRVRVTGRVVAAPEQQNCLGPARSTLPVILTFTPREQLLGLSLPSYEIRTVFDSSFAVREYVFQGSLPPGRYDVYMRPDFVALGDDCRAIPQIFRDRSIGLEKGMGERLELTQPPPSALRLTITWEARLDGWQLDMVHPVTGELISNVVQLRASDVDASTNTLVTTLNYSQADSDFIAPADELLRLTPPRDVIAGTVLLQRVGVENVAPGEGTIANVSSFGRPVPFQAWVWKEGETDVPVPGTVSFSAIELDEVDDGVLAASFEASANVDATGQVNATLLPGRYRVRVTPPGLELVELGLMAGYESDVTVWADTGDQPKPQAGHVIEVPPARSLAGQVVAATGEAPLRRVDVRASATDPDRSRCPASPDGEMPICNRPRAPVLQRALARDPLIPRTRNGLSESDGRFTINGLDCGRCESDAAPYFDLTVRPDVSTGLPWLVRAAIDPFRDAESLASTPLRIPLPVARPMQVTYDEPIIADLGPDKEDPSDDELVTRRLSGALVRVFAILDGQGELVRRPEQLVPCISLVNPDSARCLESLIQVAEARTGSDGEFLLLLPPSVE
jgi:hypothetical protein